MKKQHANAALTVPQRIEVKRLFDKEKVSVSDLATRFCCGESTIRKWINRDSPHDKSSAPQRTRAVVTPEYRDAVKNYRTGNPTHGPLRIALALKAAHPQAHRGTVRLILKQMGLAVQKKV
jgi:transposase